MKPGFFAICLIAIVSAETYNSNFLCGKCKDDACDRKNGGICHAGCLEGWTGSDCQTPVCDDVACSENGGKCHSPNKCVCFKNYAQSDDGGCYSMRIDGLKGAAAALAVICIAISFCGGLQQHFEKKARKKLE